MIGVVSQEKIDEAGAGDLHLGDHVALGQCRNQGLGDLARILTRSLGEPHGKVARHISVTRIARCLDFYTDLAGAGRHQLQRQHFERLLEQSFNRVLQSKPP